LAESQNHLNPPAFSDEMFDQIVLDVYEYVKSGTLSKSKLVDIADKMIAKRDDNGELVYYDVRFSGEKRPIKQTTMIGRIRAIRTNWKTYIAPLMESILLEAVYQHAQKAKDSTQSFKVAADLILPKESADDGNKLALPPSVTAILQSAPVGTTILIGADCAAQGTGDKGHERADTVHPVADGQRENPALEVVPSGDDKPVHGVPEGDDTAQGDTIPDTTVPSEDTVDNDSGDDMGFIERSRRVSSG